MDAVVVYESMFGMTHDVADAVAEGVATTLPGARVVCLRVGDANPARLGTPGLLIVGGPTHMRGMSSGMSRKIAVSMEEKAARGESEHQGHGLEPDVEGPGLRKWFHELPKAGRASLPRPSTPGVTAGLWSAGPRVASSTGSSATAIGLWASRRASSSRGTPASCVPGSVIAPARGPQRSPVTPRTWLARPADDGGQRQPARDRVPRFRTGHVTARDTRPARAGAGVRRPSSSSSFIITLLMLLVQFIGSAVR